MKCSDCGTEDPGAPSYKPACLIKLDVALSRITDLETVLEHTVLGRDRAIDLTAQYAGERDAALSRVEALEASLREMTEWFWGVKTEDAFESFERVGEEFYRDTGMMRPGKSYPMESYPPDDDVRRKTWDEWVKKKRDALEAKARAALRAGEAK
jgi:hypothetical protein